MAVRFCNNCSQPVSGEVAKRAADEDLRFCCCCGSSLDDKKQCTNVNVCKFGGKNPNCANCD